VGTDPDVAGAFEGEFPFRVVQFIGHKRVRAWGCWLLMRG
jgi:hypothetical protein